MSRQRVESLLQQQPTVQVGHGNVQADRPELVERVDDEDPEYPEGEHLRHEPASDVRFAVEAQHVAESDEMNDCLVF